MNKFKALILIGTASLLTAGSFAASPVLAYTSRDARIRQEQQAQHQQEVRRQEEARRQQEVRRQEEARRQQELRRQEEARRQQELRREHRS